MPSASYGVCRGEVEDFVRVNGCVENWLSKYRCDGRGGWLSGSRLNKAYILCRFFKWLRVEKGVVLSPGELLDRQLKLRQSLSVEDRQWLLMLVLKHSRDNPDFRDYADNRKYNIFTAIKNFCDSHEVVLTTAKGVYGKKRKVKNHRKQITPTEGKKILGEMSQRDRCISLIQWQSGMGIGEVLNKFNYMWFSHVRPQLDDGGGRMKIEFDERKANGTWYFTFISRDGIHELEKWLLIRQQIVEKLLDRGKALTKTVIEGEPIFITQRGTPLTVVEVARQFNRRYRGKVTTHMFRKMFESEAKVPELGIGLEYIKFFMGHNPDMDHAGGTYDRNIEIRDEIFEKEYAKLEPVVNIYSSSEAARRTDPLLEDIELLCQIKGGREAFQNIVELAKAELAEKLKLEKVT